MEKIDASRQDQIFRLLAQPVAHIGRPIAVLDGSGQVSAVDFGTFPNAVVVPGLTPWHYAWAFHSGLWSHLNKHTGRCQSFDSSALPYGTGDSFCPGSWVLCETASYAIIGRNSTTNPNLNPPNLPGFYFYRLTEDSLEVINKEAIPCLVWSSWFDDDHFFLAGMTLRTMLVRNPDEEDNWLRGQPLLLRCSLKTGYWEVLPFMDPQTCGVNLRRDFPNEFDPQGRFIRNDTNAEAWIGSERTADGDRIMLAGIGTQRHPIEDALNTDGPMPQLGDYCHIALLSYRMQRIVDIQYDCSYICTQFSPEKSSFIVHKLDKDFRDHSSLRGRICDLYLIDPMNSGTVLRQLVFDGLPSDLPFKRISVRHFGNPIAFFGTIESSANRFYVIQSYDGLNWRYVADTSVITSRYE